MAGCHGIETLNPLKELVNLKHLDVSFTQVKSLSPIAHLTKIRNLNISGCPFKTVEPICGLNNLRHLIAKLINIPESHNITRLKKLLTLEIDTQKNLHFLEGLKKLRRLNITGLSIDLPADLKGGDSLQSLHLNCGTISGLGQTTLLNNVMLLSIINCSNVNLSELSRYKNLKSLSLLSCNNLQISDVRKIHSLSSITIVTDEKLDLQSLKEATQLSSIRIWNVTSEEAETLLSFPHLQFVQAGERQFYKLGSEWREIGYQNLQQT